PERLVVLPDPDATDDNDGRVRVLLTGLLEQLHAAHDGQVEVADDQRRVRPAEHLEPFVPVAGEQAVVADGEEDLMEHLADLAVLLDDQDIARGHVSHLLIFLMPAADPILSSYLANGCKTSMAQPTSSPSPSQLDVAVRASMRSPCASCRARRAWTGSAGVAAGGGTSGRSRPSGRRNRSSPSDCRSTW